MEGRRVVVHKGLHPGEGFKLLVKKLEEIANKKRNALSSLYLFGKNPALGEIFRMKYRFLREAESAIKKKNFWLIRESSKPNVLTVDWLEHDEENDTIKFEFLRIIPNHTGWEFLTDDSVDSDLICLPMNADIAVDYTESLLYFLEISGFSEREMLDPDHDKFLNQNFAKYPGFKK